MVLLACVTVSVPTTATETTLTEIVDDLMSLDEY